MKKELSKSQNTLTDTAMENLAIIDGMERDGWSESVIDRVEHTLNTHEELIRTVKSMRLYIDTFSPESKSNFRAGGNGEYVDTLIAKAEWK